MCAVESFRGLLKASSYKVLGNEVSFAVEAAGAKASANFMIYESGIVRYRIERAGIERFRFDLYDAAKAAVAKPEVTEKDGVVEIAAAGVLVQVDTRSWRVSMKSGGANLEEFGQDLNARGDVLSSPTGLIEADGKPVKARVNFELAHSASYYGLGEKFVGLDKKGRQITEWNENAYGSASEKSYKNIPLLVSNAGYGLFLNETARSVWDIGRTSHFSLSIEVDNPGLDLFVIFGTGMKAVLRKYSDFTVKAPLPPRWSFGVWISPFGNYLDEGSRWKQKEFLEFAKLVRDKGMGGDVIHLDPYWMGKLKPLCDFKWDDGDYPDPKGFIAELKQLGFKLCLWEHPYIEKGSDLYKEAAEKGFLVKRADGAVYDYNIVIIPAERREQRASEYKENFYALGGVVDFTNSDAAAWYKTLHRPLIEMGTATFKTDFGEVIPYDGYFKNGWTGRENHNLYAYLYNRTVWEVQKEYVDRPMLWGRSGYAGSQAFPVQWSGDPLSDFRSLASTIRAGLSYGMSGVPFWSFDMGGFKGRPSPAAYVRWSQVGLMISHSRFHGTAARMPWDFGEAAEKAVMKYIELRYRLMPYLYASALQCCRTGLPFIRALPLEFQDDAGAYSVDTEYMLGDSLLVVPVLNEEGLCDIYLPRGVWYDFQNGTRIEGPQLLRRKVPLDTLPMFARAGCVIPSTKAELTVSDFWKELTLEVYGMPDRSLEIPEEGKAKPTKIKAVSKGKSVRFQASGPERNWFIRFIDIGEPKDFKAADGASCELSYDAKKRTLAVRAKKQGKIAFKFDIG